MMIVGVERQSRATKRGDLYLLGAISGIYIYVYMYRIKRILLHIRDDKCTRFDKICN